MPLMRGADLVRVSALVVALVAFPAAGHGSTEEVLQQGVDLASGSVALEIPLEVPAGTGGFVPELALRYRSEFTSGVFGVGWQLTGGEIRRSTRFGVPTYSDTVDQFELDGELLVPGASSGSYHTARESFRRVVFLPSGTWEVTDTRGSTYRYGGTPASEIRRDGSTGPVFRWLLSEMEDADGNKIKFSYDASDPGTAYLTHVQYTFRGTSAQPVGALRELRVVYEARADRLEFFSGGVRTVVTRRATEIASVVGGAVKRRLALRYDSTSYSTARSRLTASQRYGSDCPSGDPSVCAGMPESLYSYGDPSDSLPAVVSSYWATEAASVPVAFAGPTAVAPNGQDLGVRTGDLDGDGRIDLVRAFEQSDGSVQVDVFLRTELGWQRDAAWSAAFAAIAIPNAPIQLVRNGVDVCSVTTQPVVAQGPVFASGRDWRNPIAADVYKATVTARLKDINGDGLADVVASFAAGGFRTDCAGSQSGSAVVREVWLNTGVGWVRDAEFSQSMPVLQALFVDAKTPGGPAGSAQVGMYACAEGTSPCYAKVLLFQAGAYVSDLNGDERRDLLVGGYFQSPFGMPPDAGIQEAAWLSSDGGWVQAAGLAPPAATLVPHPIVLGARPIYVDAGVRLADVNGDGLADFVKGGYDFDGTDDRRVWLSTGDGWCGTAEGCETARFVPPVVMGIHGGAVAVPVGVEFADLNGDGLVDLLKNDPDINGGRAAWLNNPTISQATSSAWKPDGRFTPPSWMTFNQGTEENWPYPFPSNGVKLADLDGDGSTDLLRSYGGSSGPQVAYRPGAIAFSDLLVQRDNGRGGSWSFGYASSTAQRTDSLEAEASADAVARNDVAGPGERHHWDQRPVVSSITATGIGVGPFRSELRYAQPRSLVDTRDWLGYRAAEIERPDLSVAKTFFWQSFGRAGQVSRRAILDSAQSVLWERTVDVELLDGGSVFGSHVGVDVARPIRISESARYGGTSGATIDVDLHYDDSYGYNFLSQVDVSRPSGTYLILRDPQPVTSEGVAGLVKRQQVLTPSSSAIEDVTYSYDPRGNATSRIALVGPRGQPTTSSVAEFWAFDTFGNLISYTDAAQRSEAYCYDGDSTFASGESCPAFGPGSHSFLVGLRDRRGDVTQFDRESVTGNVRFVGLHNGDGRTFVLDAFGRATEEWFDSSIDSTSAIHLRTYQYHDAPAGGVAEPYIEREDQVGDGASIRSAWYGDGLGRLARYVTATPSGHVGVAVSNDYAGREMQRTPRIACGDTHCSSLTPASGLGVTLYRDGLGRVTRRDTVEGVELWRYAAASRAQPVGPGSTAGGTLDSVLFKNRNGELVENLMDRGRLIWVQECGSAVAPGTTDLAAVSCGASADTFYTYDPTGEVRGIYNARAVAAGDYSSAWGHLSLLYDTLGRLVEVAHPDAGTKSYSYTPTGNLDTATNARGQVVSYDWDELDRLIGIDRPPGENDTSVTYDPHTRRIDTAAVAGEYSEDRDYDELGRLSRRAVSVAGVDVVLDWERDLVGNLRRVRYPVANFEAVHEFAGGFPSRVCTGPTDFGGCGDQAAFVDVSGVAYDSLGRPDSIQTEAGSLDLEYTLAERLKAIRFSTQAGTREVDLQYEYFPAGNVRSIIDAHTTDGLDASGDFTYDARGRLRTSNMLGQPAVFNYDELGNLIGRSVPGPSDKNQYFDGPRPHAITRIEAPDGAIARDFEYDQDGNQARSGDRYRTFRSDSRLICDGTASDPCQIRLIYDVDGEIIHRQSPDGGHVSLGGEFDYYTNGAQSDAHVVAFGRRLSTRSQTGSALRSVAEAQALQWPTSLDPEQVAGVAVLGVLGLLLIAPFSGVRGSRLRAGIASATAVAVVVLPGGASAGGGGGGSVTWRRFIVMDRLGSMNVALTASGTVVARRVFDPFGAVLASSSTETSERRFAGHRFGAEEGLYLMPARAYDPGSGTFISVDPVISELGDPRSHNGYSYVLNDPLTFVDPLGLFNSGPLGGFGNVGDLGNFGSFGSWVYPGASYEGFNGSGPGGQEQPANDSGSTPSASHSDAGLEAAGTSAGIGAGGEGETGRESIRVFGVEIPGVSSAPNRTTGGDVGPFGVELPGTFAQGGIDIGPFKNLGGTSGLIGPDGEPLPLRAGSPGELLAPGGLGAKVIRGVVGSRVGSLLFGRGGVLNAGRVRVGVGRKAGRLVFRVAIGGGKQARFKLDIVEIGKLP